MRNAGFYKLNKPVVTLTITLSLAGCAVITGGGARQVTLSAQQAARIATGKYVRGDKTASVTLVEFADYECPFCAQEEPVIERLLNDYHGKLKLDYHDYPVGHPHSIVLAEAARCAAEQDAFWKVHDYLFRNIDQLDTTHLGKYGSTLGLDGAALETCIGSGRYEKAIAMDGELATEIGARGTPTFFINGKMLDGLQTYEKLAKAVDEALATSTQGAGRSS